MQVSAYILPLLGIICRIVLRVISSIQYKRRRAAEEGRRGCLPAPTLLNKDHLGICRLKESLEVTRGRRGSQYVVDAMNELREVVHTLRLPVLDYEFFVTRDPENVKAVMGTQSQDWDIKMHRPHNWMPLLGSDVSISRRQGWKYPRALVRPRLTHEQVTDLTLFEQHAQALLNVLKTGQDRWTGKVDLLPLFFNFALDVGTEFLWGQSVHSQDPDARGQLPHSWDKNGPDLAAFGNHLDEAKMWIDRRGALAPYHWLMNLEAFSTPCSEIERLVDWFVKDRLTRGYDEMRVDTVEPHYFVLLDELAEEIQDPVTLRNETLNVLIASRDTTGSTLGWIFFFLARHPRVFEKLRGKIASVFGTDTRPEKITFSGLQSCKYLQYCMNEVIRLVGVNPMNEMTALCDTTLPRGGGPKGDAPIFVPKGSQVLILQYEMHHRPDIWGPDVEEFKPERWENRKFGWEFVPFGGGLGQCIGRTFLAFITQDLPTGHNMLTSTPNTEQVGLTEVLYMVVRMLQTFDGVENMEQPEPIKLHHTIGIRSGTGVQVNMHEAPNSTRPRAMREASFDLGPARRESVW